MKCPRTNCEGQLEARAAVYLDVDEATYDARSGEVTLEDLKFSHLNDELDGKPIGLEEFELTCSEGHTFVDRLGDKLRARVGLQPIGDAPRTLGTRGGL